MSSEKNRHRLDSKFLLNHDIAPPHSSKGTWVEFGIGTVKQPPKPPDFAFVISGCFRP